MIEKWRWVIQHPSGRESVTNVFSESEIHSSEWWRTQKWEQGKILGRIQESRVEVKESKPVWIVVFHSNGGYLVARLFDTSEDATTFRQEDIAPHNYVKTIISTIEI